MMAYFPQSYALDLILAAIPGRTAGAKY